MYVTVDKSQMPLCNTPYDVGHDVKNTYTFKTPKCIVSKKLKMTWVLNC